MKEEENREYKVGDLFEYPYWGKCILLGMKQVSPQDYVVRAYSLAWNGVVNLSWMKGKRLKRLTLL